MSTSSDNHPSRRGKRQRRSEPGSADEDGDSKLPARDQTVTIKIKMVNSQDVLTFLLGNQLTVLDLKQCIFRENSIDVSRQRLIYSGRILKDDETFKKLGMNIGSVSFVHLSPLPVGQQPSNRNESLSGGSTSFTDVARMAEAAIRAIRARRNAVREAANQNRSRGMTRSRNIYERHDIGPTESVALAASEGHTGNTVESVTATPSTRETRTSVNLPSHGAIFEADRIRVGLAMTNRAPPHSMASMQTPQFLSLGSSASRLIPINVTGITPGIDLVAEQLSANEVPRHSFSSLQSSGAAVVNHQNTSILSQTSTYDPFVRDGVVQSNELPAHQQIVRSVQNTGLERMAMSSSVQLNGNSYPCDRDITEVNEALHRISNALSHRGINPNTYHQSVERNGPMQRLEIRVGERSIDADSLAAMLRQLCSVNNALSSDLLILSDQVRNANAWYDVRNNQLQIQINTISSALEDVSTATRVISRLLRCIQVPRVGSRG
mmetsp:Transcript_7742/g.11432  ORF Transcript_7742/g.11432 Transcript_7742/m.11432 type:complete len:493 (+) Transcript_7742:304-1782(+)|eukprot:CAMPEP_0196810336 /NCGR_PEP_ID=MMETSP1362-20130617/10152_1 /TAXON_ID=163516 /ORGANISM="Leptocylindrus danicus, Strain CCMP1856" /LENGTH=492 /DNA_ID=CAMNT_0042185277 /DNA_START=280 /DNA_END=1758 /DNA_ORIENTATION=+